MESPRCKKKFAFLIIAFAKATHVSETRKIHCRSINRCISALAQIAIAILPASSLSFPLPLPLWPEVDDRSLANGKRGRGRGGDEIGEQMGGGAKFHGLALTSDEFPLKKFFKDNHLRRHTCNTRMISKYFRLKTKVSFMKLGRAMREQEKAVPLPPPPPSHSRTHTYDSFPPHFRSRQINIRPLYFPQRRKEESEKGCWGGAGMRGEFSRRKCQNKGFVEASFGREKKNFRPPPFGVNHFGTQEDRRRLRRPPTATQII